MDKKLEKSVRVLACEELRNEFGRELSARIKEAGLGERSPRIRALQRDLRALDELSLTLPRSSPHKYSNDSGRVVHDLHHTCCPVGAQSPSLSDRRRQGTIITGIITPGDIQG